MAQETIHIASRSSGTAGLLWLDRFNCHICFDPTVSTGEWDQSMSYGTTLVDSCPLGGKLLNLIERGTQEEFRMTVILERIEKVNQK